MGSANRAAKLENQLMKYLFHIEGLNREVWQEGDNEKAAQWAVWCGLTEDEKNSVVQIDCIDEAA